MRSLLTKVLQVLRHEVFGFLGAGLLRLISYTLRWRYLNQIQLPTNDRAIYVFWHNRQLLLPWVYKAYDKMHQRKLYMLMSMHRDGRLISRAMGYMGINSVPGSSTRGGHGATRGLLKKLAQDNHIGMTPDGPRGPIYKVKSGVVRIAGMSGVTLYPLVADAKYKWVFASWDRMILAKPFSPCVVYFMEPLHVPLNATPEEIEQLTAVLEERLKGGIAVVEGYAYC